MTVEEVKQVFDDLRKKGHDDKSILVALGKMFEDGEITKDQLVGFTEALGAEVDPEFAKMSEEEARTHLWKTDPEEPKEGLTKEEVEDTEEDPDGEPAPSDAGSTEKTDEDEDEDEDENGAGAPVDEGNNGDDERKKAFNLLGL